MSIKWGDLREQVWLMLDDAVRQNESDASFQPDWSEREYLFYLRQALAEVALHTAPSKIYLAALAAQTEQLVVPDDVVKVGPIMLVGGGSLRTLLTPMSLEPGIEFGDLVSGSGSTQFYEWPEGTINFLTPLGSGQTLRVHYWAHYPLPANDDDLVPIMRWLETPVVWLMQTYAILKPAFQASRLGQFKVRDESGKPTDNPLLEHYRFCRRQYELLMASHPAQDRSGWETT